MRIVMEHDRERIECAIEPGEYARSRAALLVRARTKAGLDRAELARQVPFPNTDAAQNRIRQIETSRTTIPDVEFLHRLESVLNLPVGTLVVPPAAAARIFAQVGEMLRDQGSIYGGTYAKRFDLLRQPALRFADQLGRGVIALPEPEAHQWLEDLYKTAHQVDAIAVPRFLEQSRDDGHWRRICEAHRVSKIRRRDLRRVFVTTDGEPPIAQAAAGTAVECPGAKRAMSPAETSAAEAKFTDLVERVLRPLREEEYPDLQAVPLDFAVVDKAQVGLTVTGNGIGSVFVFGDLETAREFREVFESVWNAPSAIEFH